MKKYLFIFVCISLKINFSFCQNKQLIKPIKVDSTSNKTTEILKKCKANKSVEFVNIDIDKILNYKDFELNFDNKSYLIEKSKINFRSISSFSFIGNNKENDGNIIISYLDNNIQGIITKGNETYRIETTDKNEFAIIKIDHSLLKEKCEEIDKSQKSDTTKNRELGIDSINFSNNSERLKSSEEFECKIRVLVLYTPNANQSVNYNIKNTILLAIDETNQSFINSGINTELELVYIAETNYTEVDIETDCNRFANLMDGYMDEVLFLKSIYSADICVLLNDDEEYCGVAKTIGADESSAFCVVKAYNCATGYYSFGHEIGHLIGCRHDTFKDNNTTPFSFGHGYISSNYQWRTIMAYGDACNNCPRIQYWANPNINFMGLPTGNIISSNTARVWNEESLRIIGFNNEATNITLLPIFYNNNNIYTDIIAKQNISTNGNITLLAGNTNKLRSGNTIYLNNGFTAQHGTDFSASISNISDCGISLKSDLYTENTVIKDEEMFEYEIYPNPVKQKLNIDYSIKYTSNISIEIVDVFGKSLYKIKSESLLNKGHYSQAIFLPENIKGINFVLFKVNNNTFSKKIIFY